MRSGQVRFVIGDLGLVNVGVDTSRDVNDEVEKDRFVVRRLS
jgi:hypothetical protein